MLEEFLEGVVGRWRREGGVRFRWWVKEGEFEEDEARVEVDVSAY